MLKSCNRCLLTTLLKSIESNDKMQINAILNIITPAFCSYLQNHNNTTINKGV